MTDPEGSVIFPGDGIPAFREPDHQEAPTGPPPPLIGVDEVFKSGYSNTEDLPPLP